MSIHDFISFYMQMIIFGALTVTGWFFITRGEEQVMPNGSIHRYGKIFKGWYFFWTKKKREKEIIYYTGEQLKKVWKDLSTDLTFAIRCSNSAIWIDETNGYKETVFTDTVSRLGIKTFDKEGGIFSLYKEYDQYVFPWWVRDPLASCATCFASLYGSIFYWSVVLLVDQPLFSWSKNPVIAAICLWISFCLQLAVLNTAIAKKV